mgnify:CR=1 FL=1
MKKPKYLIVILLFIISSCITYWVSANPVRVVFTADFNSFPKVIAKWKGEDWKLDKEVKKGIGADQILSRTYYNDQDSKQMGLMVVYRKYGRRGFVHRPELCYPAAGWELTKKDWSTVTYKGQEIPVRYIVAERGAEREIVIYWFSSGERNEADYVKHQVWMSLDRLSSQKYGWAFIRINAPVVSSDEDTMNDIRKFVADISDPLKKSLNN